ncbi:superfamily II DNA/RNA helicase [Parabacteroides sp. PF5-5]|uniref:DEAD/DEAH box helicase n=1 Tax=unclassified Parabacteroides TaxID=2649774 RepID=UPI0024732312|nr:MULTISPECIES: DEAD/DEAH box helicase [unclassified Parabacteroides]MDH6303763.1 superfamily II DNA/RNA helicase [Parabacteroides sp. PH5-39]MDH6314380.1 superfamily II DNA/RNA helicase [Parabacteroides sp. PF5-13]MDH6318555.1 superfamily II DNA/RNA helicase [Parabacteroides sp. PH5-13]MDH6322152.1 superfamily II DNA/RNA helicase [Parabacteroides sp. PH5-8]MDH6325768.1 superfamily II DNA/RNA helicase [Parabacteroides sp. PH5-41]
MNDLISNALANVGIPALNEMQQAVLDAGTTKDMVLLSPTGSGKTLAFLLPLLTTMRQGEASIQTLIVAPSRELALQIETVFRSLGAGYKINCVYGGHPIRTEKKSLEHPPAVLIGTPGRIVDHLDRGNINLDTVRTLILDEFDKTLELGFLSQLKEILSHLPGVRRRVLTSATEAINIPAFTGITAPVRLSFLSGTRQSKGLTVYVVQSPVKDKLETLYKLLGELKGGSALIFCNLREAVERVSSYLTEMGVDNEHFHGGMEQPEREKALSHFRNGSATVFISTDLAARGLDIPEVKNVIHYHLPLNEEAYIHRNGRTARMHAEGNAFLILNEIETIPEYIEREPEEFFLPEKAKQPLRSEWVTLTINRGKRDKLSKKDVVGFLFQKGGLTKDELGVVEVKESCSYAAVKRDKLPDLLKHIRDEKIKNMKAKFNQK